MHVLSGTISVGYGSFSIAVGYMVAVTLLFHTLVSRFSQAILLGFTIGFFVVSVTCTTDSHG